MTESVASFDDDEWTNGSLDEGLNNISLDDAIDEVRHSCILSVCYVKLIIASK